jgi:hypothetical protein
MNCGLPVLAGVALLLSGCVIPTAGPVHYDSMSIDKDNAELVRVNLHMGAGDLRIGTGTTKLMQAYFTYNVLAWKPEVRHTSGNITIRQPEGTHQHVGNMKYIWDLRFSQDTPLEFEANFGAGEAQLDLGSLDLRGVTVHMGVGKLEMDLRGTPKHDYNVSVHGGIGEAVVHLPAEAGVFATATGGIGDIQTRGMRREGDHWVNDGYGRAKVRVNVDVHGGIGAITLIADGQ